MHAHPSLKATFFERALTTSFSASKTFNPFSVRTDFDKLTKGGVDVLLSSVYAPEKKIIKDCYYLKVLRYLMPITYHRLFGKDYFIVANEMIDRMEAQIEESPKVKLARSYQELEEILEGDENRSVAIVHCVEGAHCLEGKLENLDKLHKRGVAYLTLAHFYPNEAVHPVFPYPDYAQKMGCFKNEGWDLTLGLEDFGKEVIEKMIELKIILDVTHCTPIARKQIYEFVGNRCPIIATHVGAYEINPNPYNLRDWEIKRIAGTGGLVGVIFMNYLLMPHHSKQGLDYISRTIQHFVNVGGIDHVGLGSDFDGFTDPPDDIKDASQMPRLTQRLLSDGYSQESVDKIMGLNALRVLRQGWGGMENERKPKEMDQEEIGNWRKR
jgi:membrane dipeptidase